MLRFNISIVFLLTACICFSQALDSTQVNKSTYKPIFFGELKDYGIIYGFSFEQMKSISKDIVNSRECIVLDSLRQIQISDRDSLNKTLSEQISDKDTIILTLKEKVSTKEDEIFLNEVELAKKDDEIESKDKLIKWLKIQRIAYPIITSVSLIALFLSIK